MENTGRESIFWGDHTLIEVSLLFVNEYPSLDLFWVEVQEGSTCDKTEDDLVGKEISGTAVNRINWSMCGVFGILAVSRGCSSHFALRTSHQPNCCQRVGSVPVISKHMRL
ncbi:hypothetical protein ACLOJK_036175 [Asimina triloba]